MDHRPANSATGAGPTRLEWDDLDDFVKRFFIALPISEEPYVIKLKDRTVYLFVLGLADEPPVDVPFVVNR